MSNSPTSPRDWDPNHPMLKSRGAPHETHGFMRMHRAGNSGAWIMKHFKIRASALSKALTKSLNDEQQAHAAGRDIHDAVFGRKRP